MADVSTLPLLLSDNEQQGLDFPACNTVVCMDGADSDVAMKQANYLLILR